MGDIISWSIFGTVMVLAIGVAYNYALKAAEIAHSLKLRDDEIARLRKQIESLQEKQNNLSLQASNLNSAPTAEAQITENNIAEPQSSPLSFDDKTGTWISSPDGLRYCSKCKPQGILSPLRNGEHEWVCHACGEEFKDPSRPYIHQSLPPPDWRL